MHNEQYGTKIRWGGVSSDTPKNAVEIGFSGWREWADESEHGIKTYTSLEQMGLSDTDMSPEDFAENIEKIILANTKPFIAMLYTPSTANNNLKQSIINRLANDGIGPVNSKIHVKIESLSGIWNDEIKIELYFEDAIFREKTIVCYANRDGETMKIYPFREAAYIKKQTTDVELLNGWEIRNYFVIEKIGNLVNINFIIHKGVRDHGTIIFVLPPEYRPKASISVPTPFTGIATSTVSFGFNGNVIIYGWHESTGGYFIVSASYTVD